MTHGESRAAGAQRPGAGAELVASVDVRAARRALEGAAVRTPLLACALAPPARGGSVALKAECLQRTGSFKLRGALAKLSALGDRAAAGLVTASAGNHARAVAYAARLRGVSCEVFMPGEVPASKLAAVQQLGARVELGGGSVDEALELAAARAAATGATLVHPFDDLDVIAGQGTVALELIEDAPQLRRVVLPLGGGGLAGGVGAALRQVGAEVEIVGVQARSCAPYARLWEGDAAADAPNAAAGATIADGIAVKRPGAITGPLVRELLHEVVTVGEEEIADAMVFLVEHAKLVAEGAGAVAVAALRSGRLPEAEGLTVAVVSGGNVDSGLLAGLLLRHETAEGRRVRLFTRVPDRPGALAELLELVARAGANLVSVEHVREALPLHVRETGVELTLQTRGPAHTGELLASLAEAGYEVSEPRMS
ncbi:MAG TPA: pyridoxal-phosphate dependent enzyme [Solirubrobacteraceae bacterium]|nr:pyridoxal-phosphate dependent enzyme [Solirubrobacteraceae bacterium]HUB74698.1 pyridoxal-phosphate dependent enzyme [Solirubrobacteraceae bacterium]